MGSKSIQPVQDRAIRVFISSTFRDMKEEREELVKRVFPRLRRLCEKRGVTWGEVDLRWGISDEQKAEGDVLPIIFNEVKSCRPYFIGMLGECYGWVPPEIPGELIEQEPWLAEHGGRSVTELEILHGTLNDPDKAEQAFFYFRDPSYVESMPAKMQGDFLESPTPEEIEQLEPEETERRVDERSWNIRRSILMICSCCILLARRHTARIGLRCSGASWANSSDGLTSRRIFPPSRTN